MMDAFHAQRGAIAGRDHGDRSGRRRAERVADGDRARRALPASRNCTSCARRVGRGSYSPAASCACLLCPGPLLTDDGPRAPAYDAGDRFPDGIEIARRDLEIRGPGEFLGARQSGAAMLRFAGPRKRSAWLIEPARDRRATAAAARQYPESSPSHLARWLGAREQYLKA